ncbi:MAG: PfkB family carbohydrate kinase, partial [Burkholderiales bacterium]
KLAKAFVVTLGVRGALVYTAGKSIEIPCVKAPSVVDPTGCGDAFRAGLLYGIAAGLDWTTTGRLASLLGSIKIAHRGGQNHRFTRDEVGERYREAFRTRIW